MAITTENAVVLAVGAAITAVAGFISSGGMLPWEAKDAPPAIVSDVTNPFCQPGETPHGNLLEGHAVALTCERGDFIIVLNPDGSYNYHLDITDPTGKEIIDPASVGR